MSNQISATNYDEEPVTYCAKCYSLKIVYEEAIDAECCGECGCSDTKTSSIEEWEKLYKERYGHKFVEKSGDLRKHPIFSFPIKKLKTHLYKHPKMDYIIRSMYPSFPKGLIKVEAVLLFFDKLIKDKRLDEYKIFLIKQKL